MKLDKKTLEFFKKQGRKGGMKTKRKYGKDYYKKIGILGNKIKQSK